VRTCAEYCAAIAAIKDPPCEAMYPDGDCLETCTSFGWPSGGEVERSNSLMCRIAFVGVARHCEYGSASGGGRCPSNRCIPYCDAMAANCPGAAYPFADRDGCLAACSAFVWDASGVLGRSSRGGDCYLYWAGQANRQGADRPAACSKASPTSQVCP
jgi:hypothetical protein